MNSDPKTVTIIVDGTPHEVTKDSLTHPDVVSLSYPDYSNTPNITYSVIYKKGDGNKPEGTLSAGGEVKAKEGMVFSVSRTGQS